MEIFEEKVFKYRTADGKVFDTEVEATKHETELKTSVKLFTASRIIEIEFAKNPTVALNPTPNLFSILKQPSITGKSESEPITTKTLQSAIICTCLNYSSPCAQFKRFMTLK
jgi:hypothetical protein